MHTSSYIDNAKKIKSWDAFRELWQSSSTLRKLLLQLLLLIVVRPSLSGGRREQSEWMTRDQQSATSEETAWRMRMQPLQSALHAAAVYIFILFDPLAVAAAMTYEPWALECVSCRIRSFVLNAFAQAPFWYWKFLREAFFCSQVLYFFFFCPSWDWVLLLLVLLSFCPCSLREKMMEIDPISTTASEKRLFRSFSLLAKKIKHHLYLFA